MWIEMKIFSGNWQKYARLGDTQLITKHQSFHCFGETQLVVNLAIYPHVLDMFLPIVVYFKDEEVIRYRLFVDTDTATSLPGHMHGAHRLRHPRLMLTNTRTTQQKAAGLIFHNLHHYDKMESSNINFMLGLGKKLELCTGFEIHLQEHKDRWSQVT